MAIVGKELRAPISSKIMGRVKIFSECQDIPKACMALVFFPYVRSLLVIMGLWGVQTTTRRANNFCFFVQPGMAW
jgi:hypothetical protein